jgi:hypothetical protein
MVRKVCGGGGERGKFGVVSKYLYSVVHFLLERILSAGVPCHLQLVGRGNSH